jgi:signal transduction histidine kinase
VTLILLDNAIEYTANRSESIVTISLERIKRQAVLWVRDTGIGIDPANLPHIFERFYRTDRARGRQGTGLGLSIAQALVERLGGCITAKSTPGKGSTFSVWLPLA